VSSLEDTLPAVKGNAGKLQQVFLNLFLNARDAMPGGGVLAVRTWSVDGLIRVDVADNGAGIVPEHISRIFDPFFTTKAPKKGTGLGLSVSYGIVREHGGTIEVDSQRFTVVGVVPDVPILRLVPFADVWVPYTTAKGEDYKHEWVGEFMALLLLKDASKLDVTRDELWSRTRAVKVGVGTGAQQLAATPETLFDMIGRLLTGNGTGEGSGYGQRLEIVLTIGAALFMLLPAVNLVNLNISRIMERAPEIGVRKAFGASSWTLVGQFVVENVFLTLVGAAIGLAVTAIVLQAINASGLILYAELSLNYRIFGWGVVLAVAFGLLSGVYPAWRMSRMHPVQALNGVAR